MSMRRLKLFFEIIKLKYFYDFITKNSLSKELYAKICSYFFDQSCCYILYTTKIVRKMNKCFHPIKKIFKNYYLKRIEENNFFDVFFNNFDFFLWQKFLIIFCDSNNY